MIREQYVKLYGNVTEMFLSFSVILTTQLLICGCLFLVPIYCVQLYKLKRYDNQFKVIGLNTGIFWLFRTCSASFDHLIGEKTRMYFAKSLSDSIMNSYSLLPNITILIKQSTSMALQRI